MHVPECGDFRVQTEREGNLLHVSLAPVTRAEVTAQEVRSRIRGGSADKLALSRTTPVPRVVPAFTSSSSKASSDSLDDGTSYIDYEDGCKFVAAGEQVGLKFGIRDRCEEDVYN